MKRVAFIINDAKIKNVSAFECTNFNPGIGGGDYQFINLFNLVNNYDTIRSYFFHTNPSNFKDLLNSDKVIYFNFEHLFQILKEFKLDYVVLNQRFGYDQIEEFSKLGIPLIYRCGNYLNDRDIFILRRKIVQHVVCLNFEQASKYVDTKIIKKIRIIPNYINFSVVEHLNLNDNPKPPEYNITYIGSITPSKGLHLLAKRWRKINKIIPRARLNIIGSPKIYDHYAQNEKNHYYEKIVFEFEKDKESFKNVVFHGALGLEKYKIIQNTSLGIVNPSGASEVFTNSLVDFNLLNVPVISKNKLGLVSMIEDGKNGFKFNRVSSLPRLIKKIHDSEDSHYTCSDFLKSKFDNDKFSFENWILLILEEYEKVDRFDPIKFLHMRKNHNYYYLRLMNFYLRKILPFLPSILYYEFKLKYLFRKLKYPKKLR